MTLQIVKNTTLYIDFDRLTQNLYGKKNNKNNRKLIVHFVYVAEKWKIFSLDELEITIE